VATQTLTGANFDEKVAGQVAVVKFQADWCGPCRQYTPLFDATAAAFEDRALFGVVDIDANPELARRFEVMSVPTTVLLDAQGQPVDRIVGVVPASRLQETVARQL
jgi:thioredoxin 1